MSGAVGLIALCFFHFPFVVEGMLYLKCGDPKFSQSDEGCILT
jgi:hypothetical protein